MPLVPEMFEKLMESRQAVTLGGRPMAKMFCKFCPNLNMAEYREGLSEEQKDDLDRRADTLKRHSAQNHGERVSESSWEADVRADVFGKIRADSRLKM